MLIDDAHLPIAAGSFKWENRLENGIWTYSMEDVISGLQGCFKSLSDDVREKYGVTLKRVRSMGISAMMHGYIALDADGELLTPFRTWRNTMTGEAAGWLAEAFKFNIPQRWSVAHLYQSILDGEEHVNSIAYLTTLSGYVHRRLTGRFVLGVGDASGMFPIDSSLGSYDREKLDIFDSMAKEKGFGLSLLSVLPKVLKAGEPAGCLTEEGALLIDPTGGLEPGIPFCPPEGDAGTGMVATNSVRPKTGNVSAGTSVFAMSVLEKPLSTYYPEIDMVTTSAGDPVAMVHCNNCTGELDAWIGVFKEAAEALGAKADADTLYAALFNAALAGDKDCGGLLAYNYLSGEHITGFTEGRPLFARRADSSFNLANFMRVQLFTTLGALRTGMDILTLRENVKLDMMMGHGGFFKVPVVGQKVMAAALDVPVTVTSTAGEGGAWGIAVLAAFLTNENKEQTLADYLDTRVFKNADSTTVPPDKEDAAGFSAFMERYTKGLAIERAAVESL